METYLLKFSICLTVFWLVYIMLLEHQKMHNFKRFYLLGTFIIALIIPVLTITYYIEPEPIINKFELPNFIAQEPSFINIQEKEVSIWSLESVIWLIYTLGVLIFSTRFVVNLARMFRRISKNETIAERSFIYVLLKECPIPHSFFKYLFFNKITYKTKSIPKEVLLHEQIHASQLHSLDIIAVELLQIIFWFHPLIYIFKHHIKLNHEFLADQAVLGNGVDTKTYQNILLQFSSNSREYKLSSAINYSSIKKRFTVMKTQTSKVRIWISSLLLIPIIAILFYSFAEKEYVEKTPTDLVKTIKNELENKDVLNQQTINEASKRHMQEYHDFLSNFKESNIIIGEKYERAKIIYDELMSDAQRNSIEKYPDQVFPLRSLSEVEPKQPTSTQFESWKDGDKYAIWVDGKHIENSELNNYSKNDIVHFIGSKIHKNARSEKFPQPFQFNLYTKNGFQKNYKEADIDKYHKLTEYYSKAIETYLKDPQSDNSELKILKAKADKLFRSFTEDQLKKYNILPAPPVPAEKKLKSPSFNTNNTKDDPSNRNNQNVYNPSFLEYIIEMEKDGATFYLDDKKISAKKAKSIAKNNKGKRTEMITQKDKSGKYIVKLYSSEKNKVYARSIELKILNDNSYLIDGINATKETFANVFNQLHQDITPDVRNKIMNIHVSSSKEISNKEVWFIYNALQDYGFYRIVTPNQEINREKGNTPFAIDSHLSNQQKATPEQMAEYNKLAKKYNTQPKNKRVIKLKDIKRLEYLYSLMSKKQRAAAVPFPNYPPPPEPPVVKKGESSNIPPPPPPAPKVKEEIELPPPPPEPKQPLDHVIEMAKKRATFYYNDKKISSDKAIELLKNNEDLSISTKSNGSTTVVTIKM